jgi:tetratricopeptide (TPR) repeat protein
VKFFEKHLEIARRIGDRRSEGVALGSLGDALIALKDTGGALEYYRQALAILQETGDQPGEAEIAWRLGRVYEVEGDLVQAVSWMQVRVDFERKIDHPDAEEHAQQVRKLQEATGVDAPRPSEYPRSQ